MNECSHKNLIRIHRYAERCPDCFTVMSSVNLQELIAGLHDDLLLSNEANKRRKTRITELEAEVASLTKTAEGFMDLHYQQMDKTSLALSHAEKAEAQTTALKARLEKVRGLDRYAFHEAPGESGGKRHPRGFSIDETGPWIKFTDLNEALK